MVGPQDFVLMIVVMFAIGAALVLMAGAAHSRFLGSLPKERARRDPIAEGVLKPEDVDAMLEAENARLRAKGRAELSRAQLESRLVGDRKFRRRLALLRRRRRPDRARELT